MRPPSTFRRSFCSLPKLVQFAMIGGAVFGLGSFTLFLLVAAGGWPETRANAVQLVLTLAANYLLNCQLTWSERRPMRSAVLKFIFSRSVTALGSYYVFALMIQQHVTFELGGRTWSFEVHYLVANLFCVALMTIVNFVVCDRWVFAERGAHTLWYYRARNLLVGFLVLSAIYYIAGPDHRLAAVLTLIALVTFVLATFDAWRAVYSYRTPEAVDRLRFPEMRTPKERFALIVPARHEEGVYQETLLCLAKQTHPDFLILATVCHDDPGTLSEAFLAAAQHPDRITVLEYRRPDNVQPSKPLQLNYAFAALRGSGVTAVGVIDAEDTVQPELLMHIDAAFRDKSVGIVQGGVQLMDLDSSWYAVHNVLEYYKWFSSAFAFHADTNFMPLGGNTVFVRYELLEQVGGWPLSLTEDCALGVKLSAELNAKAVAYYQPELATQEETPPTLHALFRQRVRWHQGFYGEVRKGLWRQLPSFRQRLMAIYILGNPLYQAFLSIMVPVTLATMIVLKAPVPLVMLMYMPLVPMTLQLVLNTVYLHDFGMAFNRKVTLGRYMNMVGTHFVYQLVLNVAGFWSMFREIRGNQTWYKTPHHGSHRIQIPETASARVAPEQA